MSEVAKENGWTIVHGLRLHMIGQDLLWAHVMPIVGTIDVGQPSWSWLNVPGRILSPYGSVLETDIDAKISLRRLTVLRHSGEGAEGACSTVLEIEAHLIQLHMGEPGEHYEYIKCNLVISNPEFRLNGPCQSLRALFAPDAKDPSADGLWALQTTGRSSKHEVLDFHGGLVIAPVAGKQGYWRGVGRYQVRYSDAKAQPYPWSHERATVYII